MFVAYSCSCSRSEWGEGEGDEEEEMLRELGAGDDDRRARAIGKSKKEGRQTGTLLRVRGIMGRLRRWMSLPGDTAQLAEPSHCDAPSVG